ncbi:hypothetical protein MCOR06_008379 [Pyricularia oryzae]|nr:hypothetical protein MCOR06_008379 [Pyricularia oryzae]
MNRTSSKRAPGPDTAATAAPTRQCTPDGSDANDDRVSALVAPLGGSIHSPEQQSVGYMLCQGHNSEYLANYISEIALWLDMFDSQRAFGVQVPLLARSTPALILELYQEAIRLVGSLLEIRDPSVVPICTILCVMEMMSVSAQDLCGALISDGTQSTLVPLSQLAPSVAIGNPQGVATLFCASKDPDMYANYAVYLCSKACGLIASRTQFSELGKTNGCDDSEYTDQWLRLWAELQRCIDERPVDILPIQVVEASESSPSPHIISSLGCYFINSTLPYSMSIAFRHSAFSRTARSSERSSRLASLPRQAHMWHLADKPHQGCLNNAIQSLWLAGHLMSHPVEHKVVVELIRYIEATTGWGTSCRIPDLKVALGFSVE